MLTIYGIDPGFSNVGVSRLLCTAENANLDYFTVLRTAKDNKKKDIRTKSDDLRRLSEIVSEVEKLFEKKPPNVLAIEECPSIMNSPRGTRQIGMVWGAIYALAARYSNVLVFEYGPKHLKKFLTGNQTATKTEIINTLNARFNGVFVGSKGLPASKLEHAADATVAALSGYSEQPVQQILQYAKQSL